MLLAAAAVVYILWSAWVKVSHKIAAQRLGCKPAFARPYRIPLGIDNLVRTIKAAKNQVLQNEDVVVYEEMGCPSTWTQNVLGTWYHCTVDPENMKAMLATQFKDFELGPLRANQLSPLLGHGIFTSDGKDWCVYEVDVQWQLHGVLIRKVIGSSNGRFCAHSLLAARFQIWLSKRLTSSTFSAALNRPNQARGRLPWI